MPTPAPFTDDRAASVAALGEKALIARIRRILGPVCPPAPHGIGDDAAVLPDDGARPNIVTTDALFLDRHFSASDPAADAGRKLVNRNLSDLAAMGARPGGAVLALVLPEETRLAWLDAFIDGIRSACAPWSLPLVGGDISSAGQALGGTLTLWGHADRPVLRTGARPGDSLWVTGALGGSRAGRHLTFPPRIEEGAWLATRPEVRAMIDISDGLGQDIRELLPAGTQAALDPDSIPLHEDTASRRPADRLRSALGEGEDHELAFALATEADQSAFASAWQSAFSLPLTRIGNIRSAAEDAPALVDATTGQPLATSGYEYFR